MTESILVTLITTIAGVITGIVGTHFWGFLKAKNENATKIDLKKIENDQLISNQLLQKNEKLIEELSSQNLILIKEVERLEKKVQDLHIIVEKTLSSFEMMMLMIKKHVSDSPELMSALEITYEQIKKAAIKEINDKPKQNK